MNNTLKKEPLVALGTIGSLIGAFIVLLQQFGIPITDGQSEALNQFFAIAIPLVIGLIGRGLVYSPDSTESIAQASADAGTPQVPPPPAK